MSTHREIGMSAGNDTIVTDEHLPPLLGGVPIGPGRKDGIGRPARLHRSSYAFAAPKVYTPGTPFSGGSLVLRDGVTVGYDLAVRDGAVSAVLTRFHVTDAVDRHSEARHRMAGG